MAVRAVEPLPESGADPVCGNVLVLSLPGSAVSRSDDVRAVAKLLVSTQRRGTRVVAVISASDETTRALAALARDVSEQPEPRECDMLFSAGGQIAVALCAMAIHDLGVEAISLSGSQAGIVTDARHGAANIVDVRAARVRAALAQGRIVLVADAQGVSTEREITTLDPKRPSATAAALAVALDGSWQAVLDGDPGSGVRLPEAPLEPIRS